jgi:hypothetical protein
MDIDDFGHASAFYRYTDVDDFVAVVASKQIQRMIQRDFFE